MGILPKLKSVNLLKLVATGLCLAACLSLVPVDAFAQAATAPTFDDMATAVDVYAPITSFTDYVSGVYAWGIGLALFSIVLFVIMRFARRAT